MKSALSTILSVLQLLHKNSMQELTKLKQCSFKSFKVFYGTAFLKPEICLLRLNQQWCCLFFSFKMKQYAFIYMQKEEIT